MTRTTAARLKSTVALAAIAAQLAAPPAAAFCGFYVAKADSKLFNQSSKVVLSRDGAQTAITMASDYEGEPKEFAVVIPVPTFIARKQIGVVEPTTVDHLDAYTAPRLVEYHDEDPCRPISRRMSSALAAAPEASQAKAFDSVGSRGVTVEASYDVGEYDVSILSAKESDGLAAWLTDNGYKIPQGAEGVLASYIKQNMRFFVAKVNLGEQTRLGVSYLRPLQIAYESPKFMLPIRLGMVNAKGQQELFVYALTRNGRVETTNYRTAKLPVDMDLPVYLKQPSEFASFYKAMFARQVDAQDGRAVFLEYAWDMKWCDPCAADPLSNDELRRLGVFWADEGAGRPPTVFLSRLHVRYDNEHFPEDLVFQETGDRANFQGRYVLRHAWTGGEACSGATEYRGALAERHAREAEQLSRLTGWNIADIRAKMGPDAPVRVQPAAWWERLWKK
jgi:hypothetical protein